MSKRAISIWAGVAVLTLIIVPRLHFPALLNPQTGIPRLIFFLSTGEYPNMDFDYAYQPDLIENVTLIGSYSAISSAIDRKLVSLGGGFMSVKDATPRGLQRLGWHDEANREEAARL